MSIGNTEIVRLHEEIRACRRCVDDGFPIQPPPMAAGKAPAPFMVIGQAPGISDLRAGRMYQGPAARRLFEWLAAAGFGEEEIGERVYMTALTRCFPGRAPGKSTDRAPSRKEIANCREWLARQFALVQPRVVILFGKMAIDELLGAGAPLTERIGRRFERDGRVFIPLPHASGASTWLNHPDNRALLGRAIELIRQERERLDADIPIDETNDKQEKS